MYKNQRLRFIKSNNGHQKYNNLKPLPDTSWRTSSRTSTYSAKEPINVSISAQSVVLLTGIIESVGNWLIIPKKYLRNLHENQPLIKYLRDCSQLEGIFFGGLSKVPKVRYLLIIAYQIFRYPFLKYQSLISLSALKPVQLEISRATGFER